MAGLSSSLDDDKPLWQGDPAATFSDWTIEIARIEGEAEPESGDDTPEWKRQKVGSGKVSDEDVKDLETHDATSPEVYHVHRVFLSYGTRRSEYFARLFQNGKNFAEGKNNTSHIRLHALAVSAFPSLLDYVYQPDKSIEFTTENASALYHLGEYFEIESLRSDALKFCKDNIDLSNFPTYTKHATIFRENVLLECIAKFLGKRIMDVIPSDSILELLSPGMFKNGLLQVANKEDLYVSRRVSRFVAAFVKVHWKKLSIDEFWRITSPDVMPHVSHAVALEFCEAEKQLYQCSLVDELLLSSLQERCASSLAVVKDPKQSTIKALRQQSPAFLVDLLVKSADQFGCKEAILVKNAGLPAVNGVYVQAGWFRGSPWYSMPGIYKNQLCTFSVCLCKTSDTQSRWFIAMSPEGETLGTDADTDFYISPVTENCDLRPPSVFWKTTLDGIDPPPEIVVFPYAPHE